MSVNVAPTYAPTPDMLRNADLEVLAQALNDRRTRAVDVVVPGNRLQCVLGALHLDGIAPVLNDDGVTDVNGSYLPTPVGEEGIAAKLGIPLAYLRRCRAEAVDLYDANTSGWFSRSGESYLLRLLTHPQGPQPDGSAGVLRALLSTSYRCIDDFDVLLAALKGMQEAGVSEPVIRADLTNRRMIVRVQVPQIAALAPKLLEGYRSPFTGQDVLPGWTPQRMARHNAEIAARFGHNYPASDPVVFAGLVITNSETGGSAFTITPEITVRVCDNGLTITDGALRKVHLGGKLEDGIIAWSDRTAARNLALVASQTQDAVTAFLSQSYLDTAVGKLEAAAGAPVDDAPEVITVVGKRLGFTEVDQRSILAHFIRGGQATAGGVMQAVTSYAQTIPDADAAWDMQARGVEAMHAAVAAVRVLART